MSLSTDPSALLLTAVTAGLLLLKLWALIDAACRPAVRFPAAGKLTKPAWAAILVIGLILGGTAPIGLFGLLGVVAAIVYLVDVRPAVRGPGAAR